MCSAALNSQPLSVAVIGAGPVGLALALFMAEKMPQAQITTYDARAAKHDFGTDSRVLALSLGSVEFLSRLNGWPQDKQTPIMEVHVSQQQPCLLQAVAVQICAQEMSVPMLGAVVAYGDVVSKLRQRWLERVEREPQRLQACFDHHVHDVRMLPDHRVQVDAKVIECYDLAIVAEGGVFAEQECKGIVSDYKQNAWVGRATLACPLNGVAYERFTASGPAALLPLSPHEAALVWCQPSEHDDVAQLSDAQRLAVLNTVFPQSAGEMTALSEMKCFALGLNAQKSLVQGHIVRIGNAAQTLHPVAGQGLNLGLRDAYVLVEQLAKVSVLDNDLEKALRHVEFSRAPDRWSVIGMTELLARGFMWDLPLLPEMRNAALGAMQNIKPLKHLLAKRMMFGWR